MNVLNFLRRRGGSDAETRAARPQQASAQAPPQPPAPTKSDDGTSGEVLTSRRQGSQANLNKYFAAAPNGLSAVLKLPSRGEMLEQSVNGGRVSSPNGPSGLETQPPQIPQDLSYEPSVRRAPRERRKSVSLSDMAQGVQNLDVSQAALIMMPVRLKAELGHQPRQVASSSGGAQLPTISRSAGFPAGSLSSALIGGGGGLDAAVNATAPSGLGSGAALAAARGYERKPSIIWEAMKQQQQQGPVKAGPPPPDAAMRSHAPNFSSDQVSLVQLASALAGQGPERAPGHRVGTLPDRRTSMLLQPGISPITRTSVIGGHLGPGVLLVPQPMPTPAPQPVAHGTARRSDPGEGFRSRAMAPPPVDVELNSVRGLNRSWGSGADEPPGATSPGVGDAPAPAPQYPSSKDQRWPGTGSRGDGVQEGDVQRSGGPVLSPLPGDVRLPKMSGPRLSSARRDKERERDGGSAPAVARANVSPADVAAITEAMAAYKSEGGRLRAAALRRVDTKIKRAVMERHMGREPEYHSSMAGAYDSNALTPTLRSQVLMKPRLAIAPPQQPLQQARPATFDRAHQRPDPTRIGAPSGGGRPRPESYATGAGEEPSQFLPRNAIGGPQPPVEALTDVSTHRRW